MAASSSASIRSAAAPPHRARRWSIRWLGAVGAIGVLGLFAATGASARSGHAARAGGNAFRQLNLVSDIPGLARLTDPNLVNPWGLSASPTTPIWVSDNGADVSTLYTGGVNGSPPAMVPLVVKIPFGAPTGTVFNNTRGFKLRNGDRREPARFLFDSESGWITAWNPSVTPLTEARAVAHVRDAIYKGLALARTARGPRLYAADFHHGRIDVFDSRFDRVSTSGGFEDPDLPEGYGPFNIQELHGLLYVTYAKQDADAEDDVPGPGFGFLDVYTKTGHLLGRLVSRGELNAPWGLVTAPRGFGRFAGDLLVGNFGDGLIHAYNPETGRFEGTVRGTDGRPIQIDGLWGLRRGNGVFGGRRSVVFSAGIDDEAHGLLGELVAR